MTTDRIGTGAVVGGDSKAEAIANAEAKFAGRNPAVHDAWRTGDGTAWSVSLTVDRLDGPGWGEVADDEEADDPQALEDRVMIDRACGL